MKTIEQLQEENAALAAQAQALKTAAKFILDAKKPETKRKAYAALADAVNKTPQQHLAVLKAEAVLDAVKFFTPALDIETESLEWYADKIRRGEVE